MTFYMKVEIKVKLKILPGSKNFGNKKHYVQLRSDLSGAICRMDSYKTRTFKKEGQIQRSDAY